MPHPLRLLQAFTVLSAGLFGLFVFMGNLMDYDSNYQFVQHVLSMDTTFEGNAIQWRAITAPWVWTAAYIGIILAQGVFSALALVGAEWFAMWQSPLWNGKGTAMDIVTLWTGFAVLLAMNGPASAAPP